MKIKLIERIALIFMSIFTVTSFASCVRELNKNNAREICELLQKKYNIEFEVISIGDRLASEGVQIVTAYCRPKNDVNVVFEAKANINGELVFDDYYISVLEAKEKNKIESACKKIGVETTVYFSVSAIDRNSVNENIQIEELISQNPRVYLTFSTVVNKCENPGELYDTLCSALSKYYGHSLQIGIGTTVWQLEQDMYNKCLEEMATKPNVTSNYLTSLNPLNSANIAIVEGKVNISREEFIASFR